MSRMMMMMMMMDEGRRRVDRREGRSHDCYHLVGIDVCICRPIWSYYFGNVMRRD